MLTVALARSAVEKGFRCPLTAEQIDQVITRYQEYHSASLDVFVGADF